MRPGLFALGIVAVTAFVGALLMLETREDQAPADVLEATPTPEPGTAPTASSRPSPRQPPPAQAASPPPPGFKLGKGSGPNARADAQAILDDTLAELRRLDASHQTLARDVYMRGHSAAERVEDELADDDEPGLVELRAHEDAMKAELRRIYGDDASTQRP